MSGPDLAPVTPTLLSSFPSGFNITDIRVREDTMSKTAIHHSLIVEQEGGLKSNLGAK